MHVLVCDPTLAPAWAWRLSSSTSCSGAATSSLHPLTGATRHLIDRRRLALMRFDAVLVNTARGALVDEDALTEALEAGRLRAAALDVFEREPPGRSRLLDLPNVISPAHHASASGPSRR